MSPSRFCTGPRGSTSAIASNTVPRRWRVSSLQRCASAIDAVSVRTWRSTAMSRSYTVVP